MPKVPPKAALANMVFGVLLCNWLVAAFAYGAIAAPTGQPESAFAAEHTHFSEFMIADGAPQPGAKALAQFRQALASAFKSCSTWDSP